MFYFLSRSQLVSSTMYKSEAKGLCSFTVGIYDFSYLQQRPIVHLECCWELNVWHLLIKDHYHVRNCCKQERTKVHSLSNRNPHNNSSSDSHWSDSIWHGLLLFPFGEEHFFRKWKRCNYLYGLHVQMK